MVWTLRILGLEWGYFRILGRGRLDKWREVFILEVNRGFRWRGGV